MAAIKDASRREDAVARRPSLTAAIPGVLGSSGQDEETALSRTKKRPRKNRLARFYPLQTARRPNVVSPSPARKSGERTMAAWPVVVDQRQMNRGQRCG